MNKTNHVYKNKSWGNFPQAESIPTGGFRAIEDVYRTRDGGGFFKFRFYKVGDYFEIDILAMPSYGTRASGLHETHRQPSNRGGYRICFGSPEIVNSISAARKWAATWSELTMKYIKHGTQFPNT